jgi:hypothetical protein
MLSEALIEEFSRRGELTAELVRMAWPSLSVETKLQVISAHHADFSPSTPNWLVDLASADCPVVQYFALRYAHLKATRTDVAEDMKQHFQATPEENARHAKAHACPEPLVQAAIKPSSVFSPMQTLMKATQLERLVFVRNASSLSLEAVMAFLNAAVDASMNDYQLAAVAYEYFLRPDVQLELRRDKFDYSGGEAAHFAGEGIKTGWNVVRKAGRALANILVSYLPTSLGLGTVKPEELATMPLHVLEHLTYVGDEEQRFAPCTR